MTLDDCVFVFVGQVAFTRGACVCLFHSLERSSCCYVACTRHDNDPLQDVNAPLNFTVLPIMSSLLPRVLLRRKYTADVEKQYFRRAEQM